MGHHFYDLTFYLDKEKCLLYIVWALYINSQLNYPLIETYFKFFVMYSSMWNVNVFQISNPFHVYE